MESYVVYNPEDGQILWRGRGRDGAAAAQVLPDGLKAVAVPPTFLTNAGYDYSVLADHFCQAVDAEAERQRGNFISLGAGQSVEYAEAYAQALAYPNGESSMLEADVTAGTIDPRTGLPVKNLREAADLVIYARQNWMAACAKIREARLRAKVAVRAAGDNLAGMVDIVESVDWTS